MKPLHLRQRQFAAIACCRIGSFFSYHFLSLIACRSSRVLKYSKLRERGSSDTFPTNVISLLLSIASSSSFFTRVLFFAVNSIIYLRFTLYTTFCERCFIHYPIMPQHRRVLSSLSSITLSCFFSHVDFPPGSRTFMSPSFQTFV